MTAREKDNLLSPVELGVLSFICARSKSGKPLSQLKNEAARAPLGIADSDGFTLFTPEDLASRHVPFCAFHFHPDDYIELASGARLLAKDVSDPHADILNPYRCINHSAAIEALGNLITRGLIEKMVNSPILFRATEQGRDVFEHAARLTENHYDAYSKVNLSMVREALTDVLVGQYHGIFPAGKSQAVEMIGKVMDRLDRVMQADMERTMELPGSGVDKGTISPAPIKGRQSAGNSPQDGGLSPS